MMKLSNGLSVILALVCSMSPAWAKVTEDRAAGASRPPGRVNLAQGKPCVFDPAPNYESCTDTGDTRQMTDGAMASPGMSMWLQKAGVGWYRANPAIVTVDLGEVKAIGGVALHMGAGSGGVKWPFSIYLYVADEPGRFREAGELCLLSERENGLPRAMVTGFETYTTWWFRTSRLQTHGRYVAFAISSFPYTFVDELEVYGGDPAWLKLPSPGPVMACRSLFNHAAIRNGIHRRMYSDLKAVRERVRDAKIRSSLRQNLLADLQGVERDMKDVPYDYPPDFRATLPFNPIHERLFAVLAALRRSQGTAGVVVWQANAWDPLPHLGDPKPQADPRVAVDMMTGEYRSAALNITNSTPQALSLSVDITGMAGPANPGFITVHEVEYTDTYHQGVIAAALPTAQRKAGHYQIDVPSGMTRQVWLTFHPVAEKAGRYQGAICLRGTGVDRRVPLDLTLYPMRFPNQPTLHFSGWDYLNRPEGHCGPMSPRVREELQATMREHFIDSVWSDGSVMPFARYDAKGTLIAPPKTAAFDAWVNLWPDARRYMVFVSVHSKYDRWPMESPEFGKAVKAWAAFWADHIRGKGLKPEQFCLLVVDEPQHPDQERQIILWTEAIRQAGTGMKIWEDPIYNLKTTIPDPAMLKVTDVLCLRYVDYLKPDFRRYYKPFVQGEGKLELYSCEGPLGFLDPYAHHRLLSWLCWQEGAAAAGFWAIADTAGGSCWNPYTSKRLGEIYCPLFLDPAYSVTTGKHFEACREGIEDYEYLVMLKNAIARAKGRGVGDERVAQAQRLLTQLPAQVLAAGTSKTLYWREAVDRTGADEARRKILAALAGLEN